MDYESHNSVWPPLHWCKIGQMVLLQAMTIKNPGSSHEELTWKAYTYNSINYPTCHLPPHDTFPISSFQPKCLKCPVKKQEDEDVDC
ncbi:hypothetical protein ACS0TY_013162 [Phlomoides rotata]